jgi:hypothetical protein
MSDVDYIGSEDPAPRGKSRERLLRDAWQFCGGAENGGAYLALVDTAAMLACDPRKFMTERECQKFDGLPDEFTVYRGYQGENADGASWTLSLEVAEMFIALRQDLPVGRIRERRVKKAEVFACLDTDEQEVILKEYLK